MQCRVLLFMHDMLLSHCPWTFRLVASSVWPLIEHCMLRLLDAVMQFESTTVFQREAAQFVLRDRVVSQQRELASSHF